MLCLGWFDPNLGAHISPTMNIGLHSYLRKTSWKESSVRGLNNYDIWFKQKCEKLFFPFIEKHAHFSSLFILFWGSHSGSLVSSFVTFTLSMSSLIHKRNQWSSSFSSYLAPLALTFLFQLYPLVFIYTCGNHLSLPSITLSSNHITRPVPVAWAVLFISVPVHPGHSQQKSWHIQLCRVVLINYRL